MISSGFQSRRNQGQQRKNAANQFQYDLDKGAYEEDTRLLNEIGMDVTSNARADFRQVGRLSMGTEKKMKDGKSFMQVGVNQMNREKIIHQNIIDRGVRDKYYNAQPNLDKLKNAHASTLLSQRTGNPYLDIEEVVTRRGLILDNIETSLDGPETFRFDDYKADYVKKLGPQSKKNEFPLKGGGYKTIYDQRTFWQEDGKPGVNDQHAIRFLESDPEGRVARWYDDRISKELDSEIRQMKSGGAQWMTGLSDDEIKNRLINDPSENIAYINKIRSSLPKDFNSLSKSEKNSYLSFGKRVRDAAKYDLNEADRINTEVSYTGDQKDNNNSGGLWKNQNILHDDAIIGFAQEAKGADGKMGTVTSHYPGGRFTQKSGKPILLDTTNPVRTDINRGLTTKNNKGNLRLNMTGYQLMPFKAGGAPFSLKAGDTDGLIQEIENIPLENFDPNGKVKLRPEMQIGLNGFTINEAGVLNDIQNQRGTIATEMKAAKDANNKERLAALEDTMYELEELRELISSGDYDIEELVVAGNKSGIRKIQKEWIIPADQSDMSAIKNVTGGFDLQKKDYWSPDMQAVSEAYTRRAQEAKAKNYGAQDDNEMISVTSPDGQTGKMPRKNFDDAAIKAGYKQN